MRLTFYARKGTSTETLVSMLALVGVMVTLELANSWTELERYVVLDWAWRTHLRASDNVVRSRPRPILLSCSVCEESGKEVAHVLYRFPKLGDGHHGQYDPGNPAAVYGTLTEDTSE